MISVMILVHHQSHCSFIELQPNRSADWLQNKWLMLGMAIVAFIIAAMWASFGIWVVFPFAGVEIGLFSYMLYRVSLQSYHSERLSFEKELVHIQSSRRQVKSVTLRRADMHLELSESPRDWYLPQVMLVTPQLSIAIGEFLNQADRHQLFEEIRKIGIPAWRHHWWKH